MFDIVTVGHFAIDFITSPRITMPKPTLGGPPTYSSLAAAKLGARVSVISKVGEDFPPKYLKWLKSQDVDLSGLKQVEGASTTIFELKYFGDGERQLILKNRAPPIDVEDVPNLLEARAVHIAPIVNEVSYGAVDKLRGLANFVSLDPQGFLRNFNKNGYMRLQRMENPRVLERVDLFKSSQREIEAVAGESDPVRAIQRVYRYGVRLIIVTKGQEGSLLYAEGRLYRVPAATSKVVVDATGAGDVLMGAFLAEYTKEKEPLWCACVGSASASFVVEKMGPRGFGSKRQVYERALQVYENTLVANVT